MAQRARKKQIDSQGEIIDEVRKARAQLWRQYRGNMKKLHEDSRKRVKELGMHYGTPKKKTNNDEEAA